MARRAFVTAIGGQDGSYFAELLLGHGYEVYGTAVTAPEGLRDEVRLLQLELTDADAVQTAIGKLKRDEVYHLASASFVPLLGGPVRDVDLRRGVGGPPRHVHRPP